MPVDVGVDIGGTKMLMLARTPNGELAAETRTPTGRETTPKDLERAIAGFCADKEVRHLAIAVPGLTNGTEVTACDVLPNLQGWRPRADLVVNDVRAALASAPATSSVLCVVAGTAIGAAFTDVTTDVFTGADGWAGEIGYPPQRTTDGRGPYAPAAVGDAAGGAVRRRRALRRRRRDS